MDRITLQQLSALSGAPERDLHNWQKRLRLATRYQRARTGPAQEGRYTKMNTMEMLLIARFVEGGLSPAAASERVRRLFKQLKDQKPSGYAMFYGNSLACSDEPPSEQLVNLLQNTGAIVNVVPLGRFAEEIEEFFITGTGALVAQEARVEGVGTVSTGSGAGDRSGSMRSSEEE